MSFGKRLQQRLSELDISQSELARRLGTKSQSVSGWCNDILPRKDKLEQFPDALGRPLYWFFMTDSEIELFNKKPKHLTEKEEKLLSLLAQLPELEKDHIISLTEQRIKQLDNLMVEYLAIKKDLN